eukprot:3288332-Rhodomonas_salina.1
MHGTELAYVAIRCAVLWCYAMHGTEQAYGAMQWTANYPCDDPSRAVCTNTIGYASHTQTRTDTDTHTHTRHQSKGPTRPVQLEVLVFCGVQIVPEMSGVLYR